MMRSIAAVLVTTSLVTTSPACAQGTHLRIAAQTDTLVPEALEEGPIAAMSIGVVHGRDTIVLNGYGYADLENDVRASSKTVYRIGSITKQFTAAAIMQLVERGQLRLDDELTTYLTDYPTSGNHVTIHHLLTHTSGIKSYTGLGEEWRKRMPLDLTHDELLALFKDKPFDFAPGDRWLYNNSGYYLLGLVIEKVTGQAYAEYLRQHIFEPLEMHNSYYCDERTIIKHRAEGYARADGKLVNDDPIGMAQPYSAGALCSNVEDLLIWQRALNEHRVVSASSYRQMISPVVLNNDSVTSYGYGLAIGALGDHRRIGHGGGINGFQSILEHYPADDLTIVVLANTEGAEPSRFAREIARTVLGIESATDENQR